MEISHFEKLIDRFEPTPSTISLYPSGNINLPKERIIQQIVEILRHYDDDLLVELRSDLERGIDSSSPE